MSTRLWIPKTHSVNLEKSKSYLSNRKLFYFFPLFLIKMPRRHSILFFRLCFPNCSIFSPFSDHLFFESIKLQMFAFNVDWLRMTNAANNAEKWDADFFFRSLSLFHSLFHSILHVVYGIGFVGDAVVRLLCILQCSLVAFAPLFLQFMIATNIGWTMFMSETFSPRSFFETMNTKMKMDMDMGIARFRFMCNVLKKKTHKFFLSLS